MKLQVEMGNKKRELKSPRRGGGSLSRRVCLEPSLFECGAVGNAGLHHLNKDI